jgi:hypothetical protein
MKSRQFIMLFIALLVTACESSTSNFESRTVEAAPESGAAAPANYPGGKTRYLVFQIYAAKHFFDDPNKKIFTRATDKSYLEDKVKGIVDTITFTGSEEFKLGFALGPLTLDHTDEQLRKMIKDSFAIALKYNVAVVLHIDDSKFWTKRKDLWNKKENIEWLDWDGTTSDGVYINWGEPWKIAPQICFNSPEIVKEVQRIARTVIGDGVKQGIDLLEAHNKQNLFGGVIVGWETAMNPDFKTRRKYGYCTLTNKGFSKSNPPNDFDAEMEKATREWIELWSQNISAAGIAKEKIYSHVTFKPRVLVEAEGVDYGDGSLFTQAKTAFGKSHNPGFSGYPRQATFQEIYNELEKHGSPPWSISEGTNVNIYQRPLKNPAPEGMEAYLARAFNHGATLVNIFGWDVPGNKNNVFRRAAEGKEAIAAYRKFLRGEKLTEVALEKSYLPQKNDLSARIKSLPSKVEKYREKGGDLSPLHAKFKKLESAMSSNDPEKAEQAVTEIEELIGN